MSVSACSWKELTSTLDSDRKLLKKPNYTAMINQLNSLSLRLQDEELSRHAVVCHVEEANLYRKIENSNEERKQYATAASLLNSTIGTDQTNRSRVQNSCSNEMSDYYAKSISLSLEMKAFRIAGLTSLEAAKALLACNQYEMANEHAQRAVRLLEGEFYSYTRALYVLAETHFYLYEWEHLLADIDDLWMNVMKTRPRSVAGKRILKDLEVMTVLVLQRSQVTPSGRHKLLKELYEGTSSNEALKRPIRSTLTDDSSLSVEEFGLFKKFLRLLSLGYAVEARGLMFEVGYMSVKATAVKTVKAKFSFLSPLGVQVLQRFLDENQDEYEY